MKAAAAVTSPRQLRIIGGWMHLSWLLGAGHDRKREAHYDGITLADGWRLTADGQG
jgi:hypothetical protein